MVTNSTMAGLFRFAGEALGGRAAPSSLHKALMAQTGPMPTTLTGDLPEYTRERMLRGGLTIFDIDETLTLQRARKDQLVKDALGRMKDFPVGAREPWMDYEADLVNDVINPDMLGVFEAARARGAVAFMTARGDSTRQVTEEMLERYGMRADALIMRPPEHGMLGSVDYKKAMMKSHIPEGVDIRNFYDDQSGIVDMIRELGHPATLVKNHIPQYEKALGPGPRQKHLARRQGKAQAKVQAREQRIAAAAQQRYDFFDQTLPPEGSNRLLPQVHVEPAPEFYPGMGPMYHGSADAFSEFRVGAVENARTSNQLGPAFYVTPDRGYAQRYASQGFQEPGAVPSLYTAQWTGAEPPNILDLTGHTIPSNELNYMLRNAREGAEKRVRDLSYDMNLTPGERGMVEYTQDELHHLNREVSMGKKANEIYELTTQMVHESFPLRGGHVLETAPEADAIIRGINRNIKGEGYDAMRQYEGIDFNKPDSEALAILSDENIAVRPLQTRPVRPLQRSDIPNPRKSTARQMLEQQQQTQGGYVGMPLDQIQTPKSRRGHYG